MKNSLRFFCFVVVLLPVSNSFAQTLKSVDDTQNAGKVEWLVRHVEAGKTPFGVPVAAEFSLKNISKEDLILLQVRTTCQCTIADWTREAIRPGETGTIKATYDAQKEGDFYKIITVSTNFDPTHSVPFAFTGKVEKKQEAAKN